VSASFKEIAQVDLLRPITGQGFYSDTVARRLYASSRRRHGEGVPTNHRPTWYASQQLSKSATTAACVPAPVGPTAQRALVRVREVRVAHAPRLLRPCIRGPARGHERPTMIFRLRSTACSAGGGDHLRSVTHRLCRFVATVWRERGSRRSTGDLPHGDGRACTLEIAEARVQAPRIEQKILSRSRPVRRWCNVLHSGGRKS
jgi:hypothetical protein